MSNQREDLYEILECCFLFFSLIYILFRACVGEKISKCLDSKYLEEYKALADLEYRHRLLGRISKCVLHDIATPLSVLSGTLELMNRGCIDDDMENINQRACQSLEYIEGVLESTLGILKKDTTVQKFNPNDVIEKMLHMVEWRVRKSSITIEKEFKGAVEVLGNMNSFSRIFLNLLLNSIEELEVSMKRKRYIEIRTWIEDGCYNFSIEDNGNGIDQNILNDMQHGKFYSNDCNHLGVGLFFVFNTVKCEFKGRVNIESKLSEYTKVHVSIPL